jgi:hypothetical protein
MTMTRDEWLEYMTPAAARTLRDGFGFGVSAPRDRARLMWSFDGSYRAGEKDPATRYELGSRAWHAITDENT